MVIVKECCETGFHTNSSKYTKKRWFLAKTQRRKGNHRLSSILILARS